MLENDRSMNRVTRVVSRRISLGRIDRGIEEGDRNRVAVYIMRIMFSAFEFSPNPSQNTCVSFVTTLRLTSTLQLRLFLRHGKEKTKGEIRNADRTSTRYCHAADELHCT